MATYKIAIILSIEDTQFNTGFKDALKIATDFAADCNTSQSTPYGITSMDVHPEILGSHPAANNPKS